ncbi:MAG: aspartate aminotransferase family protein [Pseudomonadota bacterium]
MTRNAAVTTVLPVYSRIDIVFDHGEGSWLFDTEGRRFLDFGTGIAVNSLGHAEPHLVEALTQQAAKLWHVSNLYRIGEQERLADRLVANSFGETVFFGNSGAEAMELCIKMARRYQWQRGQTERNRIITFEGCFHGRTMASISAAGGAKMVDGFAPLLEGFDRVPFGDHDAVRNAVTEHTAAIMIEPIQGEGGIRPVPPQCLEGLRELCDEHGLLLVFDEVQAGIGRTGKLFAYEHTNIAPDIMGLAKGLGGGFPIGAVVASAKGASGMTASTHGSTFGGNPLGCAVANAVLDVMLEDGFLTSVAVKSQRLLDALKRIVELYPDVYQSVRGQGLLIGIRAAKPNADVVTALRENGLLAVPAAENVVRLLPPLNVREDEIDIAVDILDRVGTDLSR